ncbi:hypothetical protein HZH68_008279 [Vespula germanica]|uniref:Uncharacterized protein n=1 Tax=Vespula germanica TaxID=30212 RepID=A0A834K597_VESGE|nr:hypothetical protein HZH68_008279 [Vespula germanica]
MSSYESISSKTKASTMDPEKLNSICSRIICSPAITRQNLSHKSLIQPMLENKNDEDDTHFFETLKNKIKTSPLKCLKSKYVFKKPYGTRKRKHKFNEESKDAIKRFKEDMENKNQVEVDAINLHPKTEELHSETKEIYKDNSISSNCKNDVLKSIDTNVDNNESYTLKRDFTLIFQSGTAFDNDENHESIFVERTDDAHHVKISPFADGWWQRAAQAFVPLPT